MYFLIFQLEDMLKLSINFRRISAYKSYAYNKKRMWLLRFKLLEECAIIIIFVFDIEFTLLVPYDNNSMKKKLHQLTLVIPANSPRTIPKFHLISWYGSFVERHGFCRVLDRLPKTLKKLCLFTKFPHHKIRWNFGIWCGD